jgi:uncharacterized protein (TIGR03437 family)
MRQRLRELDSRLGDPRWLLLKNAEFDPLEAEPEAIEFGGRQLQATSLATLSEARTQAAAEEGKSYFIIQFKDVIKPADAEALKAQGFEIVGYAPHNAYLARTTAAQKSQALVARDSGLYRWVGAFGPALKIDQGLTELSNQTPAGDDPISISYVTFAGETPDAVRAVIASLNLSGATTLEQRADARVWGVTTVAPSAAAELAAALAEVNGVEWVELRRSKRLYNDNGVRIIQSGNTASGGGDTTLYRHGLTGAGQTLGIADAGLDSDHAQFRLDGTAAAQTLSYAVSSAELVGGLLPAAITNPNNKILVYYVLGAGGFIANANNPNGARALDPNQRSGTSFLNSVAYDDSNGYHGTHTTSVAAGRSYLADGSGATGGAPSRTAGDGVAPDARIVFQDVGHPSGQLVGVNRVSQTLIHEQAYASGARVHNNSYGVAPPAFYDEDAADIDDVTWRYRDYTIVYSAGNDGPRENSLSLIAKNNLLVGSSDSPTAVGGENTGSIETVSVYSAHGPTRDGRIKPDIIAPGYVRSATESAGINSGFQYQASTTALDAAVGAANPNNNTGLSAIAGTSFSSPMAAGGALLVRQYFTDGFYPGGARTSGPGFTPSNALVKAVIVNSGRNMTGGYTADDAPNGQRGSLPNSGQGWGRMTLDDALYFAGERRELKVLADIYNGSLAADSSRPASYAAITTGETQSYTLASVSAVEPLRITLAWSDPKSSLMASAALVNDLDLEVSAPDGTVYHGNINFDSAWTGSANGAGFDNRNNIEAVYIRYPQVGDYTLRIIGRNVPGNGQSGVLAQPGNQSIDSNRQGYSLIATGNFTAGAAPALAISLTSIAGGVNADPFISRNETVAANVTVNVATSQQATAVQATASVAAASEVPASVVSLNSGAPGQPATIDYGNVPGGGSATRGFLVTLIDDGVNRPGKKILFDVNITPSNGVPFSTQFTITAQRKMVVYRTRFETSADPGGEGVIVVPESAWGLRPGAPNTAPGGNVFAGAWTLVSGAAARREGSTMALSDPSNFGASYDVSTTVRQGGTTGGTGVYDQSRWWTLNKILLPGLTRDAATDRVADPSLTAQLNATIESLEVDLSADFSGDAAQNGIADSVFVRLRPYRNVALSATDDSGFNDQTFANMLVMDSTTTQTTNGFQHYSLKPGDFAYGSGQFGVDASNPDNSDVAFRLELQFQRNGVTQQGEGVLFDNLEFRIAVDDLTVYPTLTQNRSISVNAASYEKTAASGSLLSVFGVGIPTPANIIDSASAFPLPRELSGVAVRVNGVAAPLFFVNVAGGTGAYQINYQAPYETLPGIALVETLYNGTTVAGEYLSVAASAPAMFTFAATGQGQAVAQNQNFTINGDPSQNPAASPATRGSVLIVYANGQGRQFLDFTTRLSIAPPATGEPPSAEVLYATAETPVVTVGGVPVGVEFTGLTPGLVGLWQLNLRLPANVPTGNAQPVLVTYGGKTSLVATVAIQ